jgi:hypothetical protein
LKTFIGKSRNQFPRRLTAFLKITSNIQPRTFVPGIKGTPNARSSKAN